MRVLFLTKDVTGGVFAARGLMPAKFLEKRGHSIRVIDENMKITGKEVIDAIDACDVVVMDRYYTIPTEHLAYLLTYIRQHGKRLIYTADDDLLEVGTSHPAYADLKAQATKIDLLVRTADVVTPTTEYLAQRYDSRAKDVRIIPNCVDLEMWKERKGKNKKVKVGWAGSISHIPDLIPLAEVVRDLQKEIDFDFVIFGLSSELFADLATRLFDETLEAMEKDPRVRKSEWYEHFLKLEKVLADTKWTHVPFVPASKYNETLAKLNFDIGVCPLEENTFNKAKSCIKFYEYAMVGTTALASRVLPYTEEPVLTVKNRYDKWKSKLKHLIMDTEYREFEAQRQKAWVVANRNMEDEIINIEKIYENPSAMA